MVEQDVTESGKEFQMVGPADLNPREPNTVLTCRVRIDGGLGGGGFTPPPPPQFPCLFHCDPPPNLLVPAVLLTLTVHFSQFEHCWHVEHKVYVH